MKYYRKRLASNRPPHIGGVLFLHPETDIAGFHAAIESLYHGACCGEIVHCGARLCSS